MHRILVVDDENSVCEYVKFLLNGLGYEAGYITKPQFLMPRLDYEDYDLILLDFHMGETKGLDLLKVLKNHSVFHKIPVIMLTGENSDSIFARCFEEGAVDYIHKPINKTIFKSRVKNALDLRDYIKLIAEKNEQMETELQLAKKAQKSICSAIPDLSYANIDLIYRPYHEVSGDYYFFSVDSKQDLHIFLGDATGHGVSAAFITMMAHIGLADTNENCLPDDIIKKMNYLMSGRIEIGKFMTAIDLSVSQNGILNFCNAAHPSLLVIPKNNEEIISFSERGLAIGIMAEEIIPYKLCSYQLEPFDKVILYTDGLLDWEDKSNNHFGEERLFSFLKQNRKLPIKELNIQLVKRVEDFSCGKPNDDLTLLGLEFIPKNFTKHNF
ncbi:MAG: fused response regulator/phosphatase [Desulfobacterales bacterium]|nr:fused response regulator/phosphatase [Desulfobacterales bacterium]